MIMIKEVKQLIKDNNIEAYEEAIKEDHENKFGPISYREIESNEEYDEIFKVFEKYYDLSKAYLTDRNQVNNLKRRATWQ